MEDKSPFPWNDLLSEMHDEVVTHLDPYAKQSLAKTCHTYYKRWRDPDYLSNNLDYLGQYAPVEHIEAYLLRSRHEDLFDNLTHLIYPGVQNVFSPIDFLELVASKLDPLDPLDFHLDPGLIEYLVSMMARCICRLGTIEMYDWFLSHKRQKGWSTESNNHINEYRFFRNDGVGYDDPIFEERFDFGYAVAYGNVGLVESLLTDYLMPPLTNHEFLKCVVLANQEQWRDSKVVLQFYTRFGDLPFGRQLFLALKDVTSQFSAALDLDKEARIVHLGDLWPYVDEEARQTIRTDRELVSCLVRYATMADGSLHSMFPHDILNKD